MMMSEERDGRLTTAGAALEQVERMERRLADAEQWARDHATTICPDPPEVCLGEVEVPLAEIDAEAGGSATWGIACPFDAEKACPHHAARTRRRMRDYLARLGFHERHQAPVLAEVCDTFAAPVRAYQQTLEERIARGEGLVLGSAPGAGKTCTLALVAWWARRQHVVYVQSIDLHYHLRRHWEHPEEIRRYEGCDLLLVDDYGTEPQGAEALSRFHRLVDERVGARRATWLTTNIVRAELDAPGMARVMDRLRSASPWIEAPGESSQRETVDWRDWEGGRR
jgi:DNA replication protein DnaC